MFKKGHKLAKGGARAGAGRPADWLKEQCQALVKKHDLIPFLAKVASGEKVETQYIPVKDGDPIKIHVPASIRERQKAIEMLVDRGFGKIANTLELPAGKDGPVTWKIIVEGNPKDEPDA